VCVGERVELEENAWVELAGRVCVRVCDCVYNERECKMRTYLFSVYLYPMAFLNVRDDRQICPKKWMSIFCKISRNCGRMYVCVCVRACVCVCVCMCVCVCVCV